MDDDARLRLRTAIVQSTKNAKQISLENGWPATYVSRVLNGNIISPDPTRLLTICRAVNSDMAYVLTGEVQSVDRSALLDQIASAPDPVIQQVADFVRKNGLNRR